MSSARYKELSQRLTKLRSRLLPKKFSATGNYSETWIDRARGYRLLVHAEIESFLEDRARRIANDCVKNWQTDRKPRPLIVSLLCFHLEQKSVTRQELKEEYEGKKERARGAVQAANEAYNSLLTMNNGVKEHDVLKILLPLGIKPVDIDQTWLNTIDSFGFFRGETAHRSIKMQQPVDPKTELDTATQILNGLKKLDEVLGKIKI